MIEAILKDNPFLTQYEMAEVMRLIDPTLNAKIERSMVLRLLKTAGYRKKRVELFSRDRNSAENIALRL
jgi:hypothetical protein